MEKPSLKKYWEANCSSQRERVIEEAFALIDKLEKQLLIQRVGWRSEQLPDFDVEEINEILKDCKEKKEDLQALICRIWNKGYMTAVCDERED